MTPSSPAGEQADHPPSGGQVRHSRWRRIVWGALLTSGTLLFGGIVLLACLLGTLQLQSGRDLFGRALGQLIAGVSGMTVRVDGLTSAGPAEVALHRLLVADSAGPLLAVDDFELQWRPAALLRGTVHISNLAAKRLAVERTPSAPRLAAMITRLGRIMARDLPLDLRVEYLSVNELALIVPSKDRPAATFSVQGRIGVAAGASIATNIAFRRIDFRAASGSLAAQLEPAISRLYLALKYDDEGDALDMASTGPEEIAPVHVTLDGDGPLDAWNGRLEANLGELATLVANLHLRGERGQQVQADGSVIWPDGPPEDVPVILRPALADGLTFNADGELRKGGSVVIDALMLRGRGVNASAKGEVDPDEHRLDLDLQAEIGPGALDRAVIPDFSFQSATVQAKASGSLFAPEVRASGDMKGVRSSGLYVPRLDWTMSARPDAREDSEASDYDLQLDATAEEVNPGDAGLRALLDSGARLSATATLGAAGASLKVRDLNLHLATAQFRANGLLALDDSDSKLDASLTAEDLRSLSFVVGAPFAGRGQATIALSGPVIHGRFFGQLEAAFDGFTTQQRVLQAATGSHPTASAAFRFDRASGLELTQLHLVGQDVAASGRATLDRDFDTLSGECEADVRDVHSLAAAAGIDAAGRANLAAKLSGSVVDPDASVAFHWREGRIEGVGVDSGRLEATIKSFASRRSGDFRIDASNSLGSVEITSRFEQSSAAMLNLRNLRASVFGVRAEGDLALQTATGLISGRIVGGLPRSGVPASQSPLRGEATFDVTFAPQRQEQALDLRLRGASLGFAWAGDGGVQIGSLRLGAHVADALGLPRLAAEAHISGMLLGGEGPFEGRATADGPADRTAFDISLSGPNGRLAAIDIHGQSDASVSPVHAEISQLMASVANDRIRLRRPATIAIGRGRFSLQDLDLAIGEGSLFGGVDFRPGKTLVSLDGKNLPLLVAAPWLSGRPSGRVSLATDLHGTGSEVGGTFSAQVDDLRFRAARSGEAPRGHAVVRGTLRGGVLDVTGDAGINAGVSVTFSSRLPVSVTPGKLMAEFQEKGGMIASVGIEADLAHLRDVVDLPDQQLAGTLTGEFHAAGVLENPSITGQALLASGRYENIVTGTLLAPIEGRLEVGANKNFVVSLTAGTNGGGSIAVTGIATTSANLSSPAIDVSIKAAQAQIVHRDDLTVSTNASLRYEGNLVRGMLSGTIDPTVIEVHLLSRFPHGVVVIPVKEINRPLGELIPEFRYTDAPWIADLDISLEMPRHVFIRGRGLDSEWSGRLSISGSTKIPALTGNMGLVQGNFTFANKRFDLQTGSLVFVGRQPVDPTVDIAAVYRTSDLTAVIGVTGTARNPKLGVTSQPPLPASEVLAQILFDKSSSRLGPVESAQLRAAIASLARGESWSDDVLGSVRKFLGLDVLDADETGGPYGQSSQGSSRADRSDNEDGTAGTRQGLSGTSARDTVEVEITPWLSLQSDLTQNAEGMSGSIGLRWKHDY